jgi:hypothetical protein
VSSGGRRSAGASRKRILDIVSIKKRDLMRLQASTDLISYADYAEATGTNNCSVFLITGRPMSGLASHLSPNRGSNQVYWKGFSETLLIQSTTSDPWKWRRIVFEVQGGGIATGLGEGWYSGRLNTDIPALGPQTGEVPENPIGIANTARMSRVMNFMGNTTMVGFLSGLFGGSSGFDRNSGQFISARLDNRQIKIHSDVTRSITSGNDSGVMKTYKIYTPLNKSMTYASTEVGNVESQSGIYAAPASPLGDVYVVDLFTQLNDAPGSIRITGQSQVYWHER